jgi:hypothetical protein
MTHLPDGRWTIREDWCGLSVFIGGRLYKSYAWGALKAIPLSSFHTDGFLMRPEAPVILSWLEQQRPKIWSLYFPEPVEKLI